MKKIEISEVRAIELDILDKFVDFCKKNKLRYYLVAGTLLGAVRHQGFIPWDDDVDVGMPRPDYEKLKRLLKDKVLDDKYELLMVENNKSNYNFLKLINNKTILYEKYMSKEKAVGIWIDIFPIDGMPDSYLLSKMKCMKVEFIRKIMAMSMAQSGKGTSRLRTLIKGIMIPIVRKISISYLNKKINTVFQKNNFDKSKYVGAVSGGISYRGIVKKSVYDVDELFFEGKKYNVPKGWDVLLSQAYGNYMKLPPKEEQIQHEFKAYWRD